MRPKDRYDSTVLTDNTLRPNRDIGSVAAQATSHNYVPREIELYALYAGFLLWFTSSVLVEILISLNHTSVSWSCVQGGVGPGEMRSK